MTHTLHREGSCASLKNDYPILAMVARQFDIVDDEARRRTVDKLQRIFDVFERHGPTNLGSLYIPGTRAHGLGAAEMRAKLKANGFVGTVFDSREKLRAVLADLKEGDFGISIVVSGLIDEVYAVCDEVGLQPHTIDLSAGLWGNKKLLPKAELMEITTMCGHAMTSASLVEEMIAKVKKGRLTPEAAARKLAEPCVCGIFNQARAAELLAQLAKE